MYNLQFLEKETVADIDHRGHLGGNRVILFKLLEVPKNVIDQMLFLNETVETMAGSMKTFKSLRSFDSLPKWLKKRMKFRLKNLALFPELENFVTNL